MLLATSENCLRLSNAAYPRVQASLTWHHVSVAVELWLTLFSQVDQTTQHLLPIDMMWMWMTLRPNSQFRVLMHSCRCGASAYPNWMPELVSLASMQPATQLLYEDACTLGLPIRIRILMVTGSDTDVGPCISIPNHAVSQLAYGRPIICTMPQPRIHTVHLNPSPMGSSVPNLPGCSAGNMAGNMAHAHSRSPH